MKSQNTRSFTLLTALAASVITLSPLSSLHAGLVTFLGQDAGLGETTRQTVHPNADNARNQFLSNLSGVGTETFESFADNTALPLALSFPGSAGSITATLSGSGNIDVLASGTNSAGRFPISGTHYLDGVTASTGSTALTINFSSSISAFGFYGTDIGDFNGVVELRLNGAVTTTVSVNNSTNISGGGVLYFGVIDDTNSFNQVVFRNTGSGDDIFGFDDMTVGDIQQVVPVPEPGTALFGIFLTGACALNRRRRQQTAVAA
jgi:hypothetical protein